MTSNKRPDMSAVDDPKTPNLDAIFDLLSNEHRRHILYYSDSRRMPTALAVG
jgi:hypothetical protein